MLKQPFFENHLEKYNFITFCFPVYLIYPKKDLLKVLHPMVVPASLENVLLKAAPALLMVVPVLLMVVPVFLLVVLLKVVLA